MYTTLALIVCLFLSKSLYNLATIIDNNVQLWGYRFTFLSDRVRPVKKLLLVFDRGLFLYFLVHIAELDFSHHHHHHHQNVILALTRIIAYLTTNLLTYLHMHNFLLFFSPCSYAALSSTALMIVGSPTSSLSLLSLSGKSFLSCLLFGSSGCEALFFVPIFMADHALYISIA